MKNEEEIMVVAECKECGRKWDIKGCIVSSNGPFEVVSFVCDRCKEKIKAIEEIKLLFVSGIEEER